jgi:hypothetical protein
MPRSPLPSPACGQLVRRDNNEVAITGQLESVYCSGQISEVTVSADGEISCDYAGGSEIFWNGQKPVLQDGRFVFIDENGDEVPEINVVLRLADGTIVDPATRRPALAARA